MVVAAARHGGLGKAGVDVPANDLACPEVHGRIVHRQDVAGGAGLVVALQIAGRIEAQLLVQHIPAAVEVEIGVVGQVQDGVGVGRDAVVHPQGIVLGEDVPHRNFQVAGEAVLSRRALGLQQQGIAEGLDVVDLFGEGAVQMVSAVVGLQLVFPAAHAELRVLDAVGVPPHKGAAAGAAGRVEILFVVGKGIVAHHDIHRTLFCGDKDVFDHAAIIQHTDRQPARIRHDVFIDLFAVSGHTKGLGAKLCHRASPPFSKCLDTTLSVISFIIMIISQFASSVWTSF